MSTLAERLASTRDALVAAALLSGRARDAVRLVVVTKASQTSIFAELHALGVRDLGENRVAGALERLSGWRERFRWHFVGSLQGNKVRRALPLFDVFHGIDSLPLLERMERLATELELSPELFLQVNVSGEASKHGFGPEELPAVLQRVASLRAVRVVGLMTMAPRSSTSEDSRPHFEAVASLAAQLNTAAAPHSLAELSMGMSQDYEVAVQAGATVVRIGRRLTQPPTLA